MEDSFSSYNTFIPTLTDEQKEKIRKLDEEIKAKQEYENKNRPRKEESSKATGIPINMVDMDVVKIGILLGLIKKPSQRDTKNTNTLLNLILGTDTDTDTYKIDKTQFPSHYRNAPKCVGESEKTQYIEKCVQTQSTVYSSVVNTIIKKGLAEIRKYMHINLQKWSLPDFVLVVQEMLEVILEDLLENDDEEIWQIFNTLRKVLLGPLNICQYKSMAVQSITRLREAKKTHSSIIQALSTVEKRLILYPSCLSIDTNSFNEQDAEQLKTELFLRNYNADPELKPFNINTIVFQCCTPLLLFVPINIVLENSILNPYMNNAIGYLKLSDEIGNPWSFFVLDKIIDGKIRLWVLDTQLLYFIRNLKNKVMPYLTELFKIFYKECFHTNAFIPKFFLNKNHGEVFYTLLHSMAFLLKQDFAIFLRQFIQHRSFIIPTPYDFFNQLTYCKSPAVNETYHEEMSTLLSDLFEGKYDSSIEIFFH
jgi:hypothetical protein